MDEYRRATPARSRPWAHALLLAQAAAIASARQGINSAIAAANRDAGTENEFLAEGYPMGGHHGKDSIHIYRTRRLAG
jgi:hypothetical protein